jgi:hypothetical protein
VEAIEKTKPADVAQKHHITAPTGHTCYPSGVPAPVTVPPAWAPRTDAPTCLAQGNTRSCQVAGRGWKNSAAALLTPDRFKEETAMNAEKAFAAPALAAAVVGVTPAAVAKDLGDRPHEGGAVVPCSLDGINPAQHSELFGNAATAASYGFVQARDGIWHVRPGCRR